MLGISKTHSRRSRRFDILPETLTIIFWCACRETKHSKPLRCPTNWLAKGQRWSFVWQPLCDKFFFFFRRDVNIFWRITWVQTPHFKQTDNSVSIARCLYVWTERTHDNHFSAIRWANAPRSQPKDEAFDGGSRLDVVAGLLLTF